MGRKISTKPLSALFFFIMMVGDLPASQSADIASSVRCRVERATLSDAISIALCNSSDLRGQSAKTSAAKMRIDYRKSFYYPRLDIGGGRKIKDVDADYYYTDNVYSDRSVSYRRPEADLSLELSWLLYDFGKRNSDLDESKKLSDVAEADYDVETQRVIYNVALLYADYEISEQKSLLMREFLDSAARMLEVIAEKNKVGAGIQSDYLSLLANHQKARLRLEEAVHNRNTKKLQLNAAIGLEPQESVDFVSGIQSYTALSDLEEIQGPMPQISQRNPRLVSAINDYEASLDRIEAIRADQKPKLSLQLSGGRSDSASYDYTYEATTSTVSLNFSYNLFDGFSNRSILREAIYASEQKKESIETLNKQISLAISQSLDSIDFVRTQAPIADKLQKTAESSFNVNMEKYKAGAGSINDILISQQAFLEAKLSSFDLVLTWRQAWLDLLQAAGNLTISRVSGAQ